MRLASGDPQRYSYVHDDRAVYCWTLKGTNSGLGGTGKRAAISGFEVWQTGAVWGT